MTPEGRARNFRADSALSAMKSPLRLVFLARSLNYGGAERQLATLAKALDAQDFAVSVVTFYEGGPVARELSAAGIAVHSVAKRGRWDMARFAWRLARLLRGLRPDIIHSYLDVPNLCALALRKVTRARVVWGVRASDLTREQRQDWLSRATFRAACRLARRADLIICNSQAGRAYHLARGYPARQTIVIPNGIDTNYFTIDHTAGQRARAAWGITPQQKLVGLVGRLDAVKGHPIFLQTAAQLHAQRPDTRFVCIGDGPADYLKDLQRQADTLGIEAKITWAGGRGDLPEVYNALDVLALASNSEGWPNVLAEAMACGVPCVTTDVGDAAQIVGATGRVVPLKNPAALADALRDILDAPAETDILRARVLENFSAARLARDTAAALQQLPRNYPQTDTDRHR